MEDMVKSEYMKILAPGQIQGNEDMVAAMTEKELDKFQKAVDADEMGFDGKEGIEDAGK